MINFVRIVLQDVSWNFMHCTHRPVQSSGCSPCTARFQATTRLLLHCCAHLFNYHRIIFILPLPECTPREFVFLNFWIIFNRLCPIIGSTIFLYFWVSETSAEQLLHRHWPCKKSLRPLTRLSWRTSQTRNKENPRCFINMWKKVWQLF